VAVLSPEEDAALRAAGDELDSLEAEIEYKNVAIVEAEAVLRGARSTPAMLVCFLIDLFFGAVAVFGVVALYLSLSFSL
jgi:hypothetical protein